VNKPLPSREQALELLKKYHCSAPVVAHCKAVSKLAVQTAEQLQKKGLIVNVNLVEIGALLHDIGRSKSHGVDHVVFGAQIARENNLPDAVIDIIERHVGGGITEQEAKKLGWPQSNYMPETLEEKIVSYADKLVETSNRIIPIEVTVKDFRQQKLDAAADRMLKINQEITKLIAHD
jgi:uncharacterized protein (TIGR00295 family)